MKKHIKEFYLFLTNLIMDLKNKEKVNYVLLIRKDFKEPLATYYFFNTEEYDLLTDAEKLSTLNSLLANLDNARARILHDTLALTVNKCDN